MTKVVTEQRMILVIFQAVIKATKATMMAVRDEDNPVKTPDKYILNLDQAVQYKDNPYLSSL